jgi:hypothetical protein
LDEGGLDPGGIYSRQSNEDNGSFSYHDSEASTADDDEEEFGKGASGCSPLVMGRYEPDEGLALNSFKSLSTTKECMVLDAHPISDDATIAATIFSSSMTSLTAGTTTSSSTDALIEYNQDFQSALAKHWDNILCLIRKGASHGKPAIPTK